jgi:hypothetical protein
MSILEDHNNNRVSNVKSLAVRIAKLGEGSSVREFLDALALASGSMLRAAYKGRGVEIATSNYLDALKRSLEK